MGSGSSRTQQGKGDNSTTAPDRDRREMIKVKIRTVGYLSKFSNWREREKERAELRKNVELLRQEKKTICEELDKFGEDIDDEDYFRRRSTLAASMGRHIRDSTKPMWAAFASDTQCFLCKESVDIEVGFPCRVCTRIFHEECLKECSECRKVDLDLRHRARTNTGWSCYICGNLGLLMTEPELDHLVTKFDKYDINQDTTVSLEEFCQIRHEEFEETEGKPPDQFDTQRFLLDFQLADVDCDGKLDWWEFLNSEAQQILCRRSKDELVDMLTEKELLKVKSLFRTFDRDDSGYITEISAKEAYRNWYSQLDSVKNPRERKRQNKGDNDKLENHVELCTKLLMQTNDRQHECILWSDFLDDQALYLITSRPNQADIFRKSQPVKKIL